MGTSVIARWFLAGASCICVFGSLHSANAQSIEERVQKVEKENAELRRRIDLLSGRNEDERFGDTLARSTEGGIGGLAPSASKVYGVGNDEVSIGGYGEALYQNYSGDKTSSADFLRAIVYFGYRFDERWIFNSEIEFEHGSTGGEGSVSVEFAYLEYAMCEQMSLRAGALLVPMGFLNELHEPPTYLAATRPETETRIIPSTWREIGVESTADAGPMSLRVALVTGFDGERFEADGLRDGRQNASKAKADDIAIVARADWTDTPGVLAGFSIYHGDSGQGTPGLGDTATTIAEVHGEYRSGGLWTRGLYAMANVDDVAQLNAANGNGTFDSVGEELEGFYVEAGYDVMSLLDPESQASVSPYVRYEMIDTQAAVPAGFSASDANDFDVVTIGVRFQPIDRIVFKLDYQDFEHAEDRVNLSMGYTF